MQSKIIAMDMDLNTALSKVGEYFGARQVFLADRAEDSRIELVEMWAAGDVEHNIDPQTLALDDLPKTDEIILIDEVPVARLSDALGAELTRRGIVSLALLDIRLQGLPQNSIFGIFLPKRHEWSESDSQFLKDSARNILDLWERKVYEEKLRLSERQLRNVTENIRALIGYVDANEVIRFANAMYEEWFQIPPRAIVGRKLEALVGPNAYSTIKPRIDQALSGNYVEFETEVRYKSGPKYVHASYVPDVAADGTVRGFYSLVSDITKLKESEQLLRSTEYRYRVLTESFIDYAIFSMDVDGKIDSWNIGAENIFGWKTSEIIGRSTETLFTPEDVMRGAPQKEMAQARKTGRASDERWHVRKDGSRFFASGVLSPLIIDGDLVGYAKIAADRTAIKHNAELLQQAHDEMEIRVLERTRELAETSEALVEETTDRLNIEKQRGNLLRRLITSQEDERRRIARDIHDQLGQRVTGLRLKIASLMEAVESQPDIAERVEPIQSIGEALDSEVSYLAWELRPTVLDELGLVEAIETFVSNWSRHYSIQAVFHSTQMSDLRLPSDVETHLYRITQEALNNIVKHAEASHVSVLMERPDSKIVTIIEDDGKGFDVSQLAKFRGNGRGLGLAGMRERAELIGASIEIETERGRGTTIYITLPITVEGSDSDSA